ncbi:MAG: hypothetical protein RIR79_1094 [Pseudomonadota bacterium]|jgi:chemosensory pili system protein ChpA (sensor histidine kinase/response regulator)
MDLDILNNSVADLCSTAEQQGLLGMQEACILVQQNIALLIEQPPSPDNGDVLEYFVPLAQAYLEVTTQTDVVEITATIDLLLDCLSSDAWPMPLPTDIRDSLREILVADKAVSVPHTDVADTDTDVDTDVDANINTDAPTDVMKAEAEALAEVKEQCISQELIDMLAGEITRLCPELEHLLAVVNSLDSEPTEESMEAIATYVELIERMGMASDAVGFPALKMWFHILHGYVAANGGLGFSAAQRTALSLVPTAILAYLAAPTDSSTSEGLLDILRGDTWDTAPTAAYASALQRALARVRITEESESIPKRQEQAFPEDVSLAIPNDINQELLDGLLQELPMQTGDFSAAIQHIATGHGTVKDIDVAKRAAHTLKGAANTVGIKGIANLTHHVEDIFVALSKHHALPGRNMAQMLIHAGDCLEAMSEAVIDNASAPDEAIDVLQEVLNWANRIDKEGIPQDDLPIAFPQKNTEKNSEKKDTDEVHPQSAVAGANAAESMVRVSASLIDELLRLVGETIISTGQVQERLQRLQHQNKGIQEQNKVFLQLAAKLEEQVDIRSLVGNRGVGRAESDFDPLEFEHYSELHTISRQLIEIATDSNEFSTEVKGELSKLSEVVTVQNRLHDETQNAMMRLRMLPVSTIVSRLQRSVRQTSRLVDKEVVLSVLGAETMVDANILNELLDPLMHILRNAIDHGIEMAEQRIAGGKSPEGHITLRFAREGNQILVRCRDDGAGVDLVAVRSKAQENGLIATGLNIPDDELVRLILMPGFSTRNESTQVSGRGVGMDVVNSRILQLKGGLTLKSERGRGLEVELNVPATLISTHALLVMVQTKVFAISGYGIQDIRYVIPEELQRVGTQIFFRNHNDLLPLVHLDKLLNFPPSSDAIDDDTGGFPALLVKDSVGIVRAVRVQKIMDSRNLVVKNLGHFVPKPHGVLGATILGDGSVVAVIDIPELMRKPAHPLHASTVQNLPQKVPTSAQHQRTAMVVDDSLSARRATVQFMKDAGFDVRSAIDGIEAIAILAKWKPRILLVDMEMPRMNGLELTAHIRAQPDMEDIPIIMITSRSTEKHRSQATAAGVNVYLTKPFGDDELLEHVTALLAS